MFNLNLRGAALTALLFIIAIVLSGELLACDTWVALPDATASGFTILGKNSDRLPFSCQPLLFHPRQKWPGGIKIDLGRVSIPQVQETYATLGSSPYWCWGYEEGINEFGVAIGNEGVFTMVLAEDIAAHKKGEGPELGPTGMDLLRLGLERGKTAREALEVITNLVEDFGQFGSGLPTMGLDGAYDNSYIIADPSEAWILETAGTRWVARKFKHGTTSISNTLSINKEWDLASANLVEYALEKGWWPKDKADVFNFTVAYSEDSALKKMAARRAVTRADCSARLLLEKKGEVDPAWMMGIARDQSSFPSIDLDQTASSCVAILSRGKDQFPVFWWCPARPSRSCYVPFFVNGSKLPEAVSTAGTYGRVIGPPSKAGVDQFSSASYWWLFRSLCNLAKSDPDVRVPVIRKVFDPLEKEFEAGVSGAMAKAVALRQEGKAEEAAEILNRYTAECVEKAVKAVNELRERFERENEEKRPLTAKKVKETIDIPVAILEQYVGRYQMRPGFPVAITLDNKQLHIQASGEPKFQLAAESETTFLHKRENARLTFVKGEGEKITHFLLFKNGYIMHLRNLALSWPKPPEEREEIELEPEVLDPLLGRYSLGPSQVLTFTKEEGKLFAQMTGQPKIQVFPESETQFFYKAVPAQIEFAKNTKGKVTHILLFQSGMILQANREEK